MKSVPVPALLAQHACSVQYNPTLRTSTLAPLAALLASSQIANIIAARTAEPRSEAESLLLVLFIVV